MDFSAWKLSSLLQLGTNIIELQEMRKWQIPIENYWTLTQNLGETKESRENDDRQKARYYFAIRTKTVTTLLESL